MDLYYEPIAYRVAPEEDGMTLRTILHQKMGLSRKLVSRLKRTEQGIQVNGKRAYTSAVLQAGDLVEIRMEVETSEDILPQPLPLAIVYEDNDLLVVNKPAGMIVHPTHGHYINTLANAVVHYWREKGTPHRFRPVHRLDQDTSGALVIAKNPFVHQHISEQLQRMEVDKLYLALVAGVVEEDRGTVDAPIDRNPESPHVRMVRPDGYPAITHFETVKRFPEAGASLLRLRLETGRTHQIRVHMQSIGHPLLGDEMYGPEDRRLEQSIGILRQALHAEQLGLIHPRSGQRMQFTASLPDDFQQWMERLQVHQSIEVKQSMKLTVYHYPQCGTCRKALQWLRNKGHELELIHIVDQPPSREQLVEFVRRSGLDSKKFFNTSGQLYREMGLKDKLKTMSFDEQMDLLSAHGKLIKRPIVTDGERVTVGFKEQEFESVWA